MEVKEEEEQEEEVQEEEARRSSVDVTVPLDAPLLSSPSASFWSASSWMLKVQHLFFFFLFF